MFMRLVLLCLAFTAASLTNATDNLKAFPPAEPGMARYVLELPPEADESLLKLELLVGKTVLTDPQNRYFFAGKINEENIPGWGFTRYKVSQLGTMAGTLMSIDPHAAKVERFISLGGEPYLIRYNSRLPVVIYVPDDAEVHYRIWRTSQTAEVMQKH